jgi:hypothetical protein
MSDADLGAPEPHLPVSVSNAVVHHADRPPLIVRPVAAA